MMKNGMSWHKRITMTEAEFKFKLMIAIGQYESIYKFKPTVIQVTKPLILMLSKVGKLVFENRSAKYEGIIVYYKPHMESDFIELGDNSHKLLIFKDR